MTDKRYDQNPSKKRDSQPKDGKTPSQPKTDSPMHRFNDALRKILSVPKKDLRKK